MNLNLDGYPLVPDYAETMRNAKEVCDRASYERRGIEVGRRLADLEIAIYRDQIAIARKLLSDARKIIRSGVFEEHEIAAIEAGIELFQGATNGQVSKA